MIKNSGMNLGALLREAIKKSKMCMRARADIVRERKIQAMLDMKIAQDPSKLLRNPSKERLSQRDATSFALERAFRRDAPTKALLQMEFDRRTNEGFSHMGVAEVYLPLRIAEFANEFCLVGGWSLDVTMVDEKGQPLDSSKQLMREKGWVGLDSHQCRLQLTNSSVFSCLSRYVR